MHLELVMKKIKVLHINTSLSKGGSAIFMKNLTASFHNTEVESKFFGLNKSGFNFTDRQGKVSFLPYLNYITHLLLSKDYFTVSKRDFYQNIDDSDIVHIHVIHSYILNFEQFFGYLIEKKKPVIVTLHDAWFFTGRCAIPLNCREHENFCMTCPSKDIYPASLLDRTNELLQTKIIFYKRFKGLIKFISPSKWLQAKVQRVFPEQDIDHIPNGIIIPDFHGFKESKLDNKVAFIINDFRDNNKVDISYLSKLIESQIDLSLVGKNQPIEISKKTYSINNSINNAEVLKILNETKCFLILSKFENFPTILIEALINGCCVLTTRNNGSIEILNNFILGLDYIFVENSDLMDIKNFLFKNSNIDLFHARRDKAIELFDIKNTSNSYLDKYKSLLV